MAGIEVYGRTGQLVIGAVALCGPAWDVPDLSPLWISGELRGSDRIIPGASGVLPFKRRRTVTEVDLDMLVVGMVSSSGAAYDDALEGLELNLEALRSGVVEPTGTGDGTRNATLTMPSGNTRTGDVHVLGLEVGSLRAERRDGIVVNARVRAVLSLSIPSGRLD